MEIIVEVGLDSWYDVYGYPDSIKIYKPKGYKNWMRPGLWEVFKDGCWYINPNVTFKYEYSDYIRNL